MAWRTYLRRNFLRAEPRVGLTRRGRAEPLCDSGLCSAAAWRTYLRRNFLRADPQVYDRGINYALTILCRPSVTCSVPLRVSTISEACLTMKS